MRLTEKRRNELQARGGAVYRAALKESRKLTEVEENEIRTIEAELDRDEYERTFGDPNPPSDAQRRFTASVETRDSKRPLFIPAETRMVDVFRGSFQPEYAELTTADFLRQFISGDGSAVAKRAMAEGTVGAGGALVPVQQSLNVVDALRSQSVIFRAGAQTFPMASKSMTMPRLATDPTADVYAENASITASDGVLEQITFSPFKIAALVKASRELIMDSDPSASALLENALAAVLALKLDALCLYGAGTTEPQGIYAYANTTVPEILAGANGLLPVDYTAFSQAVFTVFGNNATPSVAIYSPRTAGTLDRMASGISGDKTPLTAPESWANLRKIISTQVLDTSVVGTSGSVCSTCFIGDFTGVAVGVRQQIQIQTSDQAGTAFADDQVWLKATLRGDFQLLSPKKLCVLRGIKAS